MNYLIDLFLSEKLWIGLILGLIPLLVKYLRLKNDKSVVIAWLKKNTSDLDGKRFRTTTAICNGTNMTPERVTKACYSSNKVRRNSGEKESWTLYTLLEDDTFPKKIIWI